MSLLISLDILKIVGERWTDLGYCLVYNEMSQGTQANFHKFKNGEERFFQWLRNVPASRKSYSRINTAHIFLGKCKSLVW